MAAIAAKIGPPRHVVYDGARVPSVVAAIVGATRLEGFRQAEPRNS